MHRRVVEDIGVPQLRSALPARPIGKRFLERQRSRVALFASAAPQGPAPRSPISFRGNAASTRVRFVRQAPCYRRSIPKPPRCTKIRNGNRRTDYRRQATTLSAPEGRTAASRPSIVGMAIGPTLPSPLLSPADDSVLDFALRSPGRPDQIWREGRCGC